MLSSNLFQHLLFDRDNPHAIPCSKLAIGSNRIPTGQKATVEAPVLKTLYGLFIGKVVRFEVFLLHPVLLKQKERSVGHGAAGTAHSNPLSFRVRIGL